MAEFEPIHQHTTIGLAWDARGNQLFIADFGNHCIRYSFDLCPCFIIIIFVLILVICPPYYILLMSFRKMTASGDCTTIGVGGLVLVDDCIQSKHHRVVSSSLGCQDGPSSMVCAVCVCVRVLARACVCIACACACVCACVSYKHMQIHTGFIQLAARCSGR